MTDLDRAIAAAREALARPLSTHALEAIAVAQHKHNALADLIADLDAARGQAVAWFDPTRLDDVETFGHTLATLYAHKENSSLAPLYAAPPQRAVPAMMKYSTLDDARNGKFYADAYVDGWNECRAAVLAANKENTND